MSNEPSAMREVVRVASLEADGGAARLGAGARHAQHLVGRVDGRHVRAGPGEDQRRARRAGADVDRVPAVERSAELRQDARLRLGQQLADRPAEPRAVEGIGHRGIGVDRVAVVIGPGPRGGLGHAALPESVALESGPSRPIASRVRAR